MNREKPTIALLGAGSWGTAVAIHLAHSGHPVLLWGRQRSHVITMQNERMNSRYLPHIVFPSLLLPTHNLQDCLKAQIIIISVPSHAFASVLEQIDKPSLGLAWLTKGLDPSTNYLLSDLVTKRWGETYPIAILSGPSFALEVAKALPTALTLASNDRAFQKTLQTCFHHQTIRIYLSQDIIGIQLCGAIKNVLAIACGISDGLGYGANAKAALITRGLAEMTRLGKTLGGREESFRGLAGIGDLVLTCTDNQSRNRRFGLQVGQGVTLSRAEKEIGQVVEGKYNAAQVCMLAHRFHVEMPICEQVNALLNGQITPQEAVGNLMNRVLREE